MQLREISETILEPGEYSIRELMMGLDFIVVTSGRLKDKTFAIWDDWNNSLSYAENVPITLHFCEWRSWRTLWRWRSHITATDGCNLVAVTEQTPDDIPVVIHYTGKMPDFLKE